MVSTRMENAGLRQDQSFNQRQHYIQDMGKINKGGRNFVIKRLLQFFTRAEARIAHSR